MVPNVEQCVSLGVRQGTIATSVVSWWILLHQRMSCGVWSIDLMSTWCYVLFILIISSMKLLITVIVRHHLCWLQQVTTSFNYKSKTSFTYPSTCYGVYDFQLHVNVSVYQIKRQVTSKSGSIRFIIIV